MKKCDRKTLELLVLGCWAHEEISIGRARELLGWPDDKIRMQAEQRVSIAVKLREERDRIDSERANWERKCAEAREAADTLYRLLRQLNLVMPLNKQVVTAYTKWPWLKETVPSEGE